MSIDPRAINLECHVEIGKIIARDADLLTDRWMHRATLELPTAAEAQRSELRDELPSFLRALGQAVGESETISPARHRLLAVEHGEQRWKSGWRLAELIRDYQILRLVLLDHLEQSLDRALSVREVMAVGLGLDEAIGAAAVTYSAYQTHQLRDADERIASVVDHALSGILMIDNAGRIESFNPAAERIFGYPARSAIGLHASELFPELTSEAADEVLAEWLIGVAGDTGGRIDHEVLGRHRDGSIFPLDLVASPFHLSSARRFTAIVRDITDRKRTERELTEYAKSLEHSNRALAAATLEAEAANRTKSEFLANMSHEIRTPMTAILGFADVLANTLAEPDNVEIAHTIKRNGEHLIKIVNDILDLSKIEAGKAELVVESCSPRQIAGDVQSLLAWTAQRQGLKLDITVAPSVPEAILCDGSRLRQILVNLVANGIKFTEHGGVQIHVDYDDQPRAPIIEFAVIDTGLGMTQEQLEQLFVPFARLHRARSPEMHGTGLGLAISKRLAAMLGGEITVTSEPQQGSTFILRLPVVLDQSAPAAEHSPSETSPAVDIRSLSADGCRLLLAEDGRDNQLLITRMLGEVGVLVEIVDNGQAAIEQIEAALHDGQPFDVVLMDMQMPIMDGSDATRELRARGHSVPIIALTASAMKGDREHCLSLGCSDYLAKPIDRQLLLETVVRHRRRTNLSE